MSIVNTHSPAIVQLVGGADLLFATTAPRRAPDGSISRGLLLKPLTGTWRAESEPASYTKADIIPYLAAPPGAQLRLGIDAA
jgi:hypothetical protein